jgi:ferric-dicitrate binding protein FerR (iron transport regulator)
MDCEQALTLISARLDHEIAPADRARLDAHVAECPACSATAEAFRLQDADLRDTFADRRSHADAVADRVLARLPDTQVPPRNPRRWHRVVPALTAAAAAVALVVFLQWSARQPAPVPGGDTITAGLDGLTARPRAEAPPAAPLAVGQKVETGPGQRRRVALPDGSVLYVNQNSAVALDRDRRLALSRGEVFVEVTPARGEAGPFVVQSPRREITALGTKFAVRADADRTGLLVTQGSVKVNGQAGVVPAGFQLEPDSDEPTLAPRASHLLDWTRELMEEAESPLVPGSQFAGGALVAVDASGQEARLTLRKYHIDVHVEDGFARTTIDQTYFNHANWRLEGTFHFPLPPDASLSRLAMYVDGKLMEGGMVERDFGRQVYERIVHSQRDPALLEWLDGSTFKMRVFPLEARQEKRIVLSYTQRLPADYGRLQYRFPAGHSLEVVRDWSFHARVKGGAAHGWGSPSHTFEARNQGDDLVLDSREREVAVNQDVVLYVGDPSAGSEGGRFAAFDHEGARYLMVRYRPALARQEVKAAPRRDWVFLFESSGDRDPLVARTQIEIIRTLLGNVEHTDRFAVLTAGTNVRAFAPELKEATPENIQAALAFLDKSHLIGALDLGKALAAAEPLLKSATNPHLVHVGSGVAAMGERREDVLAKRVPEGTRYVGVGVGKRWSRAFMKAAAERTGGHFTQINPDESVSWRGFELYSALALPRLMDVKVTDDAGRTYLAETNAVAHGEEVCAVVRMDREDVAPPPAHVTVSGTLDGERWERVLPVRDVPTNAGHLPRTWAKLEIDRLLADDSRGHKDVIVTLSKASYVMTPFTSLLVLESEKMYEEFKVDRGRKDHWALYPCPEKIPVVYEPDPNSPIDPRIAAAQKPSAQQVMQTVAVRVPPRCLTWPGRASGPGGTTVTALSLEGASHAVPGFKANDLRLTEWGINGGVDFGYYARFDDTPLGGEELGMPVLNQDSYLNRAFQNLGDGPEESKARSRALGRRPTRRGLESAPRLLASPRFGEDFLSLAAVDEVREVEARLEDLSALAFSPDGRTMLGDGSVRSIRLWDVSSGRGVSGERWTEENLRLGLPVSAAGGLVPQSAEFERLSDREELFAGARFAMGRRAKKEPAAAEVMGRAERLLRGEVSGPRHYGRPSFSGDERVFSDLVSYAPGMNTSRADIRAVLDAEAAPRLSALPGRIDPAARSLIDRARAARWQSLTLSRKDGTAALTFAFDGAGRYAYERTLPLGLREQVVCDGTTLLHLYPDLGIGARRTVSRFHRADLAALVPWMLPPAEDLARGRDVERIDERTVALSPRGASAARTVEGKPAAYLRAQLVFAEDGRLAERQTVLMPEGKVLLRQTYAADGTIKVLSGEDKELASHTPKLAPAKEPDLKPDTSALVVLPLPLRTREHAYRSLGLNPGNSLDAEENLCYRYLEGEEAMALFASEYAQQNPEHARQVYRHCFEEHGVRRPGFWALLASCGDGIGSRREFVAMLSERPHDPLMVYLALLGHPHYRKWHTRVGLNLGEHVGEGPNFFRTLASFRDRWLRWQQLDSSRVSEAVLRDEQRRGLEFVRGHKDTPFAWSLLALMRDRTDSEDGRFHQELADAWGLFRDHPSLGYPARYEQARSLLRGGRGGEARAQYREMFEQALKANVLPAIDGSFREALQDGDADEWSGLMRQTAAAFVRDGQRPAVVALAWQCWQLGDQPLAANLLETALHEVPEDERLGTTLAAVGYLWQTSQYAPADDLLRSLLDDRDFQQFADLWPREHAALWRLSGRIAEARGVTARSIACLERALDLEYRDLPEVINLEEVRRDYGKLLEHYQSLAQALATLKAPAPRDLPARTVRAADRWRALDRQDETACQSAAQTLRMLGAPELAWEYLTTPIGQKPNEADPWVGLAKSLNREGNFALADRAYASAFETEPTNAQILWDRVQNLRQAGRHDEAQPLLRQIADTEWQPRFAWIKSQARWQLEGR